MRFKSKIFLLYFVNFMKIHAHAVWTAAIGCITQIPSLHVRKNPLELQKYIVALQHKTF